MYMLIAESITHQCQLDIYNFKIKIKDHTYHMLKVIF